VPPVLQEAGSLPSADPGGILIQAQRSLEDPREDRSGEWLRRARNNPEDREAVLGLAALSWLQYRYGEADEWFETLLAPGQPRDETTAYAWLSRGDAAQLRGDFRGALDAYQEALRTAEEVESRRAQAWSHLRLAGIRGRLEGLRALQDHLVAAEALLEDGDTYLWALFHCSRAGADPQGRLNTMEDLELGASLAEEAGVRRLYAACRQVQASVFLDRGETLRALELFHEAQAIQADVGDRAGRAGSLQRAGHVYVSLGAHGWAQSYLEQAIVEGEASESFSAVAWALMNLSTISWTLGDLASARAYTARAEAMMVEQGDVVGLDVATGQKGDLAFAGGDFASAREYWEEALARYRERGNSGGVMGVQTALMRLAMAEGDLEGAEAGLALSRETGRAAGRGSWVRGVLYDEGEIALRKGDMDRARRALTGFLEGGQMPFRAYKARVRLAEVAAREGKIDEAERELRAAIEGIEGWRTTLDASGLRRYAFQVAEYVADPDLGVATVLASLAEGGRVRESFDLAERQRARGLFEGMVRADAARDLSLSRPLAGDAPPLDAPSPLSADELLAALPDDGIGILLYVTGVGGEPTTVFILAGEEITAAKLAPIDSLRDDIERLAALVRSGTEPASIVARLGRELLQPAVAELPVSVRRLAIIPDGPLHRIPWDVLRLASGERTVERYSVSTVPSASVLAELWKQGPPPPASTLLAFGDPDRSSGGENGVGPEPRRGPLETLGRELPPLPGSAREARFVARFAEQSEVRTGAGATEAFLKATPLDGFRVLHFATHALVDEATVSRTALVLAPEGEEDGFVLPGDLARLNLQADLVVLSACRTAGGSVIRGEGIQGLTGPLLEAGARSILATGWDIEDRADRRLVEDLYRALARGETVGESLRSAKLSAIDRGETVAHWAAFSLVGDPQARVFLNEPTPRRTVLLGFSSTLLLVAASLLLAVRKRRCE
jgi:tetratricopeptide (TPR) repeat protein